MRGVRRLAAVAGAVVVGTVLLAQPAGAHAASPDTNYYRAEITGITPAVAGVTARVDPVGEWIEVTNTGPAEVIILGYAREPYLRVTAAGVQENELSSSAVLNRALFADLPTSTEGNSAPPVWKPVASKTTARWHDHRIHWMGQSRPPAVTKDPTRPHPVGTWTVHATADGKPFEVTGTLRWLGKPADGLSWFQILTWVVLGLMVVAVAVLTVALVRARRRAVTPRW
jgi:hypothetical protein